MAELRSHVARVAASRCSVLLTGETGTGKGVIAREIHALSALATGPMIHVDCAALSSELIESELFGHERGAFTGASMRRRGRFEMASEGTLFLDEIAELAPSLQAKFLRVLQDRQYERVGGSRSLQMGARIVAATNRALDLEVIRGRFRSDLYYRLAVVQLRLPPLRERIEDLPGLVEAIRRRLSNQLGRIVSPPTPAASRVLAAHAWPGNVRELMNALERFSVCWPDCTLDRAIARAVLGMGAERGRAGTPAASPGRCDLQRIESALRDCSGNVSGAARLLGIPRSTLRYRLARSSRESPGRIAPSQLELPWSSPNSRWGGRVGAEPATP